MAGTQIRRTKARDSSGPKTNTNRMRASVHGVAIVQRAAENSVRAHRIAGDVGRIASTSAANRVRSAPSRHLPQGLRERPDAGRRRVHRGESARRALPTSSPRPGAHLRLAAPPGQRAQKCYQLQSVLAHCVIYDAAVSTGDTARGFPASRGGDLNGPPVIGVNRSRGSTRAGIDPWPEPQLARRVRSPRLTL